MIRDRLFKLGTCSPFPSPSTFTLSGTRPLNTKLVTLGFLNKPGTRSHFVAIMPSSPPSSLPGSIAPTGANYSTSVDGSGKGTETAQTRSGRSGDGLERFKLSPIPTTNPLGEEGRCIRTASALVIGWVVLFDVRWFTNRNLNSDEILNGKTMDKNSNYFAKYCFERGIDLWVTRNNQNYYASLTVW